MARHERPGSGQHQALTARGTEDRNGSKVELAFHKGPLPPAEQIERYAAVYPDAPRIIFQAFESQVAHRQNLERTVIESNARAQERAPIIGGILAGLVMIGGFLVVLLNKDPWGYAAILTAGAGLVGTAIWMRKEQAKERREKEEALARSEAERQEPQPKRLP